MFKVILVQQIFGSYSVTFVDFAANITQSRIYSSRPVGVSQWPPTVGQSFPSVPGAGTSNPNPNPTPTPTPVTTASNVFNSLNERPALTSADAGKGYIYSKTNTVHTWSGSSWQVQDSYFINVLDYGAIGNFDPETGTGFDSTAIVQALINRNTTQNVNKPLYFPAGTYGLNIVTGFGISSIFGQGHSSTKLCSYTPDGYVITVGQNDNWKPIEIKDLKILGNTALTRNGVQYGKPVFTFGSQYCAALKFINVVFDKLGSSVIKRYGNIGNYFESCHFYKADYHYQAFGYLQNGENDGMNSGCDTFYKCVFDQAQIASIFIDAKNSGVNGQHVFRDCIFQTNPGYAIFVKDYDYQNNFKFCPGISIENTWFEFNASKSLVTLDGETTKPYTICLKRADARIEGSTLYDIRLVRSQVISKNSSSCVFPATITKDEHSSIVFENNFYFGDFDNYSVNPQYTKLSGAYSLYTQSKHRSVTCSDSALVKSISFASLVQLNAANSPLVSLVNDGLIFDQCNQLIINSSNNTQDQAIGQSNFFALPLNKYIFWSIAARKISGQDIGVLLTGGFQFCNPFQIKKSRWTTYVGLGDTFGAPSNTNCGLVVQSTGKNSVIRLSCFQILAFDTLQELTEYSQSLCYSRG